MSIAASGLRRSVPNGILAAAVAAAVVLAFVARLSGLGDSAQIGSFALVFTSIVVEALPFILLGALVSAIIEVFVSDDAFARIARLPLPFQVPGAALGGFAFPVCECGSVPVARRLIARGIHPAAGLAFMLASPILNPIVLWSTYVAYKGLGLGWEMLFGRAALGFILAIAAAWAIGTEGASNILRKGVAPAHTPHESGSRLAALVDHLAGDFSFMARFVVVGAALAALLQTAVPQGFIADVAGNPVGAALALMALAFLLSLCSEADAFVAVSFTQFPLGSHLAFLVFGPVVDAKLSFLYGATFRNNFVLRLIAVAVPIVLAGSLWFQSLVV